MDADAGLRFSVDVRLPVGAEIWWQVVNTGEDAARRGLQGLRGKIFSGDPKNWKRRKETTLYRGVHWIECFVVKDRKCIGRSGRFYIKIV